jgi:hypothetical protein
MLKRILILSFLVCGLGCSQDAGSKAPQPENVPYAQYQETKDTLHDYVLENRRAAELNKKFMNDINVFINELKDVQTIEQLDKALAKYNIQRNSVKSIVPPKPKEK